MTSPPIAGVDGRSARDRAKAVQVLGCDVDGVLTDGKLYLNDRGEEMKAFSVLDGHGIKALQATGVVVAIITGRSSATVALRARELGIAHLVQGAGDKLKAWKDLLQTLGLTADQSAFIGDDLPDLPVLRHCGFAAAVPQACDLILRHVHYVTLAAGGTGAVREVCDLIMDAQGTLGAHQEPYLR